LKEILLIAKQKQQALQLEKSNSLYSPSIVKEWPKINSEVSELVNEYDTEY